MRKLLALTVMILTVGAAVPAAATPAPPPPPPPEGWTAIESQSGPFWGTNPCTGEPSGHLIQRLTYRFEHTDGFTSRLYHYITTSDGWSSNGWHRGRTYTEIGPGGNQVITTVYSVALYDDDGTGVMFGRNSATIVVLEDGTTIVEHVSPFELTCVASAQD